MVQNEKKNSFEGSLKNKILSKGPPKKIKEILRGLAEGKKFIQKGFLGKK